MIIMTIMLMVIIVVIITTTIPIISFKEIPVTVYRKTCDISSVTFGGQEHV